MKYLLTRIPVIWHLSSLTLAWSGWPVCLKDGVIQLRRFSELLGRSTVDKYHMKSGYLLMMLGLKDQNQDTTTSSSARMYDVLLQSMRKSFGSLCMMLGLQDRQYPDWNQRSECPGLRLLGWFAIITEGDLKKRKCRKYWIGRRPTRWRMHKDLLG